MSDTDELQRVLADATGLHGDVRVRGTAARSVRARARQRRASAIASGAAGAVVCVVVGVLALTGGGSRPTAVPPAVSTPTVTHTLAAPVLPQVAAGAHSLAAPVEIRPVRAELSDCPRSHAAFVLAAVGPSCYRLDQPWLVMHRLAEVDVGLATKPSGLSDEGRGVLYLTMVAADRELFADRTSANVGQRIALVAGNRVWSAPVVATPIEGGQLGLDLSVGQLRALLDVLGITYSLAPQSADGQRICSDRPPQADVASPWKPSVLCRVPFQLP